MLIFVVSLVYLNHKSENIKMPEYVQNVIPKGYTGSSLNGEKTKCLFSIGLATYCEFNKY